MFWCGWSTSRIGTKAATTVEVMCALLEESLPLYPEKIELGCGVKQNEFDHLLDFGNYEEISKKCKEVYSDQYSSEKFKKTFLSCFVHQSKN